MGIKNEKTKFTMIDIQYILDKIDNDNMNPSIFNNNVILDFFILKKKLDN